MIKRAIRNLWDYESFNQNSGDIQNVFHGCFSSEVTTYINIFMVAATKKATEAALFLSPIQLSAFLEFVGTGVDFDLVADFDECGNRQFKTGVNFCGLHHLA